MVEENDSEPEWGYFVDIEKCIDKKENYNIFNKKKSTNYQYHYYYQEYNNNFQKLNEINSQNDSPINSQNDSPINFQNDSPINFQNKFKNILIKTFSLATFIIVMLTIIICSI